MLVYHKAEGYGQVIGALVLCVVINMCVVIQDCVTRIHGGQIPW